MRIGMILTLLIGAFVSFGCGGDDDDILGTSKEEVREAAESLCRANADCEQLDSAWIEGCMVEPDRQIKAAEGYDCLGIMAEWFDCIESYSSCTADGYSNDREACREEEEMAEDCRNGRL